MRETSNCVHGNMELEAVGRSRGAADTSEGSLCAPHKPSKHFTHVAHSVLPRTCESYHHCSSLPLSTVLLSVVSVTCGQPWSEDCKWKILEISSSTIEDRNHQHYLLLTPTHWHRPGSMIQDHPKQMTLLSCYEKVNSSLTLTTAPTYSPHLISSHGHCIILRHHKKGKCSRIR